MADLNKSLKKSGVSDEEIEAMERAWATEIAARDARRALMTPEEIQAEEEREEEEEFQRWAEEAWEEEQREIKKRNRERRPIKDLRLRIKRLAAPKLTPGSRNFYMLGWFVAWRLAHKCPIVLPGDKDNLREYLVGGKGGALATLEKGVSVLVFPLHDRKPEEVWDVLADGIYATELACLIRVEAKDFVEWWDKGLKRHAKWVAKINARNDAERAKRDELSMQVAMASKRTR